jgi:hypothetical protein
MNTIRLMINVLIRMESIGRPMGGALLPLLPLFRRDT